MKTIAEEKRSAIARSLQNDPGAVLEYLALDHSVSVADIVACLPEHQVTMVDGALFETVMLRMADWGDVTFLVHTDDVILEARGTIPKGSFARGYFNLHGGPIGGHIKGGNCRSIAFVTRPLFKSETKSVQFFNANGDCMFKVYLGRDENRELMPGQIAMFDALSAELGKTCR
ncbi:heme utilization cystosolic carrier protein HutX [uncultured Cohaesibacter sp.]|uniref:heme utilization cystosolic carrier protein HutX n=1 Tax=uncultured Cohaesibacter sp. TaxID=1002546 RepID=UPI0029C7CB16|nr:heme utilization cystosolic carrier protein HutX [uncultured Cohaesibacter sp.]